VQKANNVQFLKANLLPDISVPYFSQDYKLPDGRTQDFCIVCIASRRNGATYNAVDF
jgi:hypothetical protein